LQEGARLAEAAMALPDPNEFGTHLVGLVAAGSLRFARNDGGAA
jgi:hypothetical protein